MRASRHVSPEGEMLPAPKRTGDLRQFTDHLPRNTAFDVELLLDGAGRWKRSTGAVVKIS